MNSGASGFIAAHVCDVLVQHGHDIVATVRSDEKGQKILSNHPGLPKSRLSYFIVEDISQPGAFDEAVKVAPFDAVIHTASPFHFNIQHADELLEPAVQGTTGILKAIKASAPTVKRVAITSSFASIINAANHAKVYSEEIWNPVTREQASVDNATAYRASKTLAEKAAWEFVEKEKPGFELSTLCPPLVLGPVVHYFNSLDAINTSNVRVRDMIQGKCKEKLPPTGIFIWVDVRDLALAHVKAIELPEAAGKRFLITEGYYINAEIAKAIKDNFPNLADKLPAELVSDRPKDVYGIDNSRSLKVLGLKYRSLEESIVDTVKSLLAAGA